MQKYAYRTPTQSGFLDISWSKSSREEPWPDFVDFVGTFGCKVFTGIMDFQQFNPHNKHHYVPWLFSHLNDAIIGKHPLPITPKVGIEPELSHKYFSKEIYHEDPTGKNWHTPLVYFYDSQTNKWDLTKGSKKIVVLDLAGITQYPAIIMTNQKESPLDGFRKCKKDQALVDFLQQHSGNLCDTPSIGMEFRHYNGVPTPVIHFLNLNDGFKDRSAYEPLYRADLAIWRKYRHKSVHTDLAVEMISTHKYHKSFISHPNLTTDIHKTKKLLDGSLAAIICQQNPVIFNKLLNALVWLSTNAKGQEMGAWISRDQRYGVIFNSQSDLVMELPPGLTK